MDIRAVLSGFAIFVATPSFAEGTGGSFYVSKITLENNKIYITGSNIQNPDSCGSSTVVVIKADKADKDRMFSVASMTKLNGKTISVWLVGCEAAPWYSSIPAIYSMTME